MEPRMGSFTYAVEGGGVDVSHYFFIMQRVYWAEPKKIAFQYYELHPNRS